MEQFDVIVIGSGSGMLVASAAVDLGVRVALVENGKMGGTCINVGCVPIQNADLPLRRHSRHPRGSEALGIHATVSQWILATSWLGCMSWLTRTRGTRQ